LSLWQALEARRFVGRRGSQICWAVGSQMAAVRLSATRSGRHLIPGGFLVLIFIGGWVGPGAVVRLEGLGRLINKVTANGLKPATFRVVALCLNQLRCRVPPDTYQYT
jgi:hypothetical protein